MSRRLLSKLPALVLILSVACAANTPFRGIPVASLTDEELIGELQAAVQGYGIQLNRSMFLITVRPDPAYVLTSSTTSIVGSATATYNAYAMPVGYGVSVSGSESSTASGTATTQYQYTDVNAAARLGNSIALAITRSRQRAYRRRALDVLAEYDRRVAARRAEAQSVIDSFFAQNTALRTRRQLVAAVAPWAAATAGTADGRAILQRTKEMIDSLPRGAGLAGRWYGTFAQTTTMPRGESIASSQFVHLDLRERGDSLLGDGVLGTGEVIELRGAVHEDHVNALVANTTSGINVSLTALAAPTQISGSFAGAGTGMTLQGTFTLLR